jgi:hypothetical protein
MSTRQTVPVTTRALIQRINRKLAPQYRQLKVARGEKWRNEVGDYCILDADRNIVAETHVDVVALARELGAMQAWESKVD